LRDLADAQTLVIEQLKQEAGKYVDRVLAISIEDPGLWFSDFDDQQLYLPMCDPTTIAEATGIAVIDALPLRDLSVGGSGTPLAALPLAELPAIKWEVANPGVTTDELVQHVARTNPQATLFIHLNELDQDRSDRWNVQFERLDSVIGSEINLEALVAAILGMFHIDQLPGRPSNWRQLIRAMAQHHPAPMKLKDAI